MAGKHYQGDFYQKRHQRTLHSATRVLDTVLKHIPAVKSAVDLGCGVGSWLSVLQARGATDVLGMEGSWVDQAHLVIPKECFREADLTQPIKVDRKFDLAMSLEVGEHLPRQSAEGLVEALTSMSDYVVFSAAVPGQGGRQHINEQWQSWWAALFSKRGFQAWDVVRPEIWNDASIPFWYRQNIILYIREGAEHRMTQAAGVPPMMDLVHPELVNTRRKKHESVKGGFKLMMRAALRRVTGKQP